MNAPNYYRQILLDQDPDSPRINGVIIEISSDTIMQQRHTK